MTIKQGDYVKTPRFLNVRIEKVFNNEAEARKEGYKEASHYEDERYKIEGKHIGENRMLFAAIEHARVKERDNMIKIDRPRANREAELER